MNHYDALALMITMLKARQQPKKKKPKSGERTWITINPGPGGGGGLGEVLYLCKKKGEKPPTECTEPGSPPGPPPGDFTAPCVFCDPVDKQKKFDDWLDKQLALNALQKMLEVMKAGQFWGGFADMLSDMYDAVSALTGPGSMAFKAAKWGAGELYSAATDAAKEAAMQKMLEGIIAGLGLDLTPDDLSTEGGLNAAIALASGIAGDAYADYQTALAKWASCRSDAAGAGKIATNTLGEAQACNDAASDAANAAQKAWLDAMMDWQAADAEFQRCVEYNSNLTFETAVWQNTPC